MKTELVQFRITPRLKALLKMHASLRSCSVSQLLTQLLVKQFANDSQNEVKQPEEEQ